MSIFYGKHALVAAFQDLVTLVDNVVSAGIPISEINQAPTFSYVLTKKQFSDLSAICVAENWPIPSNRGIEIDVRYIAHVLNSRDKKDNADATFVAAILNAAFCDHGQVAINRTRHQQAIILNSIQPLALGGNVFKGLAIVEVKGTQSGSAELAAITAYHAGEAKIRRIQRK